MTETQSPAEHRLTRYRHEESEMLLARGTECLLLAEEDNYQDKELLTEACDSFIEAIKFNRQHTEAYLGMAYLLWLLGDQQQALAYLEQGLRTQPSHPDVHRLIQHLSGKSVQGQSAPPSAVNNAVKQQIEALLSELETENAATIAASVNPHMNERLQERLSHWEQAYEDVLSGIDALDSFHDRVMLTCDLSAVQDRIMAYHQALKGSERLLKLDDKIMENRDLARQYVEERQQSESGMFQAYLDIMLDNCDTLADELDLLERDGLNIGALDSHYQQLVDHVEELQGLIQESE